MEYILGSGLIGAPKMMLKLDEKDHGTAHITQPVSPPVDIKLAVHSKPFNITKVVTGLYVVGDQDKPGGPCCGATIVLSAETRPGEPGTGTFWWVDSSGLHDSGLVAARPAHVKEAVGV